MNKLLYDSVAQTWTQALPLGNGHLGAMVFGGETGKYDLSHVTNWSGRLEEKCIPDDAHEFMQQAREALINGNIVKGEELISHCNGIEGIFGTQLPLILLWISAGEMAVSSQRSLDLRTGISSDSLCYENKIVQRESFISNPDKVMAIRLSAAGKLLPDFTIRFEGVRYPESTRFENGELIVTGQALEKMHSDGIHGVPWQCRLCIATDGIISQEGIMAETNGGLHVKNAREIKVYLAVATGMFRDDYADESQRILVRARQKGWAQLLETHIVEHSGWMDRCTLVLPDGESASLPTDQRLERYNEDDSDQGLVALLFQYGRYLILNSSRPDSELPAVLQGAWNDNLACNMVWTDGMTMDINTELNYYPIESTGLSECIKPLFKWINDPLSLQGHIIAENLYGCPGWVTHTVANAYGWSAPGWGHTWGYSLSCGAWVTCLMWQHYLYTRDTDFLKTEYPVMRGAAEFLLNLLMPDPKTGEWLVVPSYSPENGYMFQGDIRYITVGSTFDTVIAKYLFHAVIETCKILGMDADFSEKLAMAMKKMPDFKIGQYGQLMEWQEDYVEAYPDHRHTSHLVSLYPFGMINPVDTPDLAQAVRTTLDRRMANDPFDIMATNWSGTLLICYYARLLQGDDAAKCINHLVNILCQSNLTIPHKSKIYELDGNTGFTSGIAEMLLQSYRNEIHILPAISPGWKHGSVSGMVAEGGHRVSVKWKDSMPYDISVVASQREQIKLHFNESTIVNFYEKNQTRVFTCQQGQLVEL